MTSKFDLGSFRYELAGLDSSVRVEQQKAEKRKEIIDSFIKKIKGTSKIVHDKLKGKKEPTEDDAAYFEFLDKISTESRTPYEELLNIKERTKEVLVYTKELLKKIDATFERISDKKEVSYTERNLAENNQKKLDKLSGQGAKDDHFLELVEEDIIPVTDRILIGVN